MLRHSIPHFPPISVSIASSRGTQSSALPRHQSEEMKILNISFTWVGIESITCPVYTPTLVPLRHDWPQLYLHQLLKMRVSILNICQGNQCNLLKYQPGYALRGWQHYGNVGLQYCLRCLVGRFAEARRPCVCPRGCTCLRRRLFINQAGLLYIDNKYTIC